MAKQNGGTGNGGGRLKIVNTGIKAGSRSRDLATPAGATQPGAIEYQGSRPLFRGTPPEQHGWEMRSLSTSARAAPDQANALWPVGHSGKEVTTMSNRKYWLRRAKQICTR